MSEKENVKDKTPDKKRVVFHEAKNLEKSGEHFRRIKFKSECLSQEHSRIQINRHRCWPLWYSVLQEIGIEDIERLFEETGCCFLMGKETVYLAETNLTSDRWDVVNMFYLIGLYPPLGLVRAVLLGPPLRPPYDRLGYKRIGKLARYIRKSIKVHKKKYKQFLDMANEIEYESRFETIVDKQYKVFGKEVDIRFYRGRKEQ